MTLTPTCEIRACKAAQIFDDPASEALFAEYVEECANPMIETAVPDTTMYEALEQLGTGQCFGAYEGGSLCGFAFVMAGELPGYKRRHARVERLFVSSKARATGLGTRLMAAIESHARNAGCAEVSYSAPVAGRLATLLHRRPDKYPCTNHVFCRRLA